MNSYLYPFPACDHVHPQSFEVFEDCIGLYATDKTNANQLTCLIKDVLCRSGLPLCNCRGQCYDGAANMSERRSGVATKIQQLAHQVISIAWAIASILLSRTLQNYERCI